MAAKEIFCGLCDKYSDDFNWNIPVYLIVRITGKSEFAEGILVNIKETKKYYDKTNLSDLCSCTYCQNYVRGIKSAYPKVAEYLSQLGVDIEKPFETMPLEPDETGYIEYICAQYIVCGENDVFTRMIIESTNIDIAESHPSTGISATHFVIEIYPIRLKWVM